MICWRPAKERAMTISSKTRGENPASALLRKLAPISRHDWLSGAANGTGKAGAVSEIDMPAQMSVRSEINYSPTASRGDRVNGLMRYANRVRPTKLPLTLGLEAN